MKKLYNTKRKNLNIMVIMGKNIPKIDSNSFYIIFRVVTVKKVEGSENGNKPTETKE